MTTWLRAIVLLACCAFASAAQPPSPKDDLRPMWKPQSAQYLRRWLLCGEFPNPPKGSAAYYDHTPPCVGFDTDYLGGEADAAPREGQEHKRPDGSTARWTVYQSPTDLVDLRKFLQPRPSDNAVMYAYTTVEWPENGPAVLALGSDDGIMAFVNGKRVHTQLVSRRNRADDDLVAIQLVRGANRILLKIENGSADFSFTARVCAPGDLRRAGLNAWIVRDAPPDKLVVQLDHPLWATLGDQPTVQVRIYRPGGLMSSHNATRGQRLTVDCARWPQGPYEVRWALMDLTSAAADTGYLSWYKGDLLADARAFVAAPLPGDKRTREFLATGAMLQELVLDRMGGTPQAAAALTSLNERAATAITSALMEWAEMRDGRQVRPDGFLRLAYVDEVDDSVQFCRTYLPPGYNAETTWPMVVILHGYNPSNPRYIRWWSVDQRQQSFADKHSFVVIEPHGRGNTGYGGIGLRDVLRCVELAKSTLRIDPNRVYLTGYSMGGAGTWVVGTRHPELFAAVAPIYGGWDYRNMVKPEEFAAMDATERAFRERWSSYVQAESLLSTPVFVNHGDDDELVHVDQSRYAVRLLQRWGYDVRYWEHPGGRHGGLGCEDEMARWFLRHRLVNQPRTVRVRAMELKSARAHWLAVLQREDPFAEIRAEAQRLGPATWRLDTVNALEAAIGDVPESSPVTVLWNGKAREAKVENGRAVVRASGYQPGPSMKSPQREGPIADATGGPFVIVQGTASDDPRMRFMCGLAARRQAEAWRKWQHVMPRVILDRELTDADLQRYSLLLMGGPADNLITRRLADRLPLSLSPQAIVLDGRSFAAPGTAICMVYPHPLNPERYVRISAANTYSAMFFLDDVPEDVDFVITDGRLAGEGVAQHKVLVARGLFGQNWRLHGPATFVGDPELRAKAPVMKTPAHLSIPADVKMLYLSDLLESDAAGSFARMSRDRSWRGGPMKLGQEVCQRGLAVNVWRGVASWADFALDAHFSRLKATLALEVDAATLEPLKKERTSVFFIVRADDKEVFRRQFRWDTPPQPLDLDMTGVRKLRLEVTGEGVHNAAQSVNWGEVRVERSGE